METLIKAQLRDIETREHCRILLAVESGSRAWGFPSPDSDYDVRFLYVRPKEFYLKLEQTRDVIELPISDALDINGWDLDKTLRLLYHSNPTLFEWLSSPVVYETTPHAEELRAVSFRYFSSKSGLWHYLHMAEGNYRAYLRGEMVRAKKYFYVLRPLLACLWILDRGTPPPVPFADLAAAQLDPGLQDAVAHLLDLKMNSPEVKEIPRIALLNDYIEETLPRIRARISALPEEPAPDWEELNSLFRSILDTSGL